MNSVDKDRIKTLGMIALYFLLILGACIICEAQDNHEPVVLDMKVKRIPVSYIDKATNNIDKTLSSQVDALPESIERVCVIFIGQDVVLLFTESDTLELWRLKTGNFRIDQNNKTLFYDPHNYNQPYYIKAVVCKTGAFTIWFIPLGERTLYTYRSQSYDPVKVFTFKSKNLYAISIGSIGQTHIAITENN